MQRAGDRRLTRIGSGGQRDDGAEALFEAQGRGGRGALRDQVEFRGVAGLDGERDVLGIAQEIVHIRQVAFQRKRDAAANGEPEGAVGGDAIRRVRGWRAGGCAAVAAAIRLGAPERARSGAIWVAPGTTPRAMARSSAAGGGDQDLVGVVEGLEKRERGGGKFGVERRGSEAIEIDSGERDGGGGYAGG